MSLIDCWVKIPLPLASAKIIAGPLPITTGASSGLIPGWSPDNVTSSAIAKSGFNLNAEVLAPLRPTSSCTVPTP